MVSQLRWTEDDRMWTLDLHSTQLSRKTHCHMQCGKLHYITTQRAKTEIDIFFEYLWNSVMRIMGCDEVYPMKEQHRRNYG